MTAVLPIIRAIWGFLSLSLKIPLWLMLIAVLAHFWLQHSAVHKATANLVARAELEAAKAKAEGLQKIADDAKARADTLKAANDAYAKQAAEDSIKIGNLDDQINELLSKPVNDQCIVDRSILDRLRNL